MAIRKLWSHLDTKSTKSWLPSSPFHGADFIISIMYFLLIKITFVEYCCFTLPMFYILRQMEENWCFMVGGGQRDREGERKGEEEGREGGGRCRKEGGEGGREGREGRWKEGGEVEGGAKGRGEGGEKEGWEEASWGREEP